MNATKSLLTDEERRQLHMVLAEQNQELREALQQMIDVIDSAGLHNLTNGVQLGPTIWYVKACDAMDRARAAIAKNLGPCGVGARP